MKSRLWRPERIVIDDPYSDEEPVDPAARDGAIDWWEKAMASRGNGKAIIVFARCVGPKAEGK